MILVIGPLYSGKRAFACRLLHCEEKELSRYAVWDVQERAAKAENLECLADELARWSVVIATEIGGGVVPTDPAERAAREAAGRLNCLLSQRADTVVRVFYDLPLVLKGSLSQ